MLKLNNSIKVDFIGLQQSRNWLLNPNMVGEVNFFSQISKKLVVDILHYQILSFG